MVIDGELARGYFRLVMDSNGRLQDFTNICRSCSALYGGNSNWRGPVWMPMKFYEYLHGDNGRGVGASHQTGWTGVVAELINRVARAEA